MGYSEQSVGSAVEFLEATDRDAEVLAEVQGRAFGPDAATYGSGPPGYNDVKWQRIAMATHFYYKIVLGDRIVGGIILHDQGENEYYLHRLFIDPEFQHHGVASRALEYLEATFPARRWTLHTPNLNVRNQRFYEKRGFIKIGEMRPEGQPLPDDFVLYYYEKRLP